MKVGLLMIAALGGMALLTGCQSPQFAYSAAPERLDVSGPRIVVLPLADSRTNRESDDVFRKGYLTDVQAALGQELQSMRYFSSVTVAQDNENPPDADFQLTLTLEQLDWEVPNHGAVETEKVLGHTFNFIANLTVGLPAGNLVLHSGTPIYGRSAFEVAVRRTKDQKLLWNMAYSETVTNRVKKSDCDKAATRATVMLAAFQTTQAELKEDLLKELVQEKYADGAGRVAGAKK